MTSPAVASPSGELSFATASGLLESCRQAGEIDLAQISRADSAGLSLLLELTRRARKRGAEFTIRNANEQVRGLAAFFGVDSVLKFQ